MTKFKLYYDKDKETKWLNEMADKGYAMTGFFAGFYKFEKCEPGEWRYQVDFGNKLFRVTEDYQEFMEETGAEVVQCWGYWIILRKKASEGAFELYTDVDSNITHYKKIRTMFKVVTIIEILAFMIETLCVMQGAEIGWFFMGVLAIIIIAFMRAIATTNKKIAELMERKGENVEGNCGSKNVSPILLIGLFLNLIAVCIDPATSDFMHGFRMGLQIVAIIAMLYGIYQSRWVFKNDEI